MIIANTVFRFPVAFSKVTKIRELVNQLVPQLDSSLCNRTTKRLCVTNVTVILLA